MLEDRKILSLSLSASFRALRMYILIMRVLTPSLVSPPVLPIAVICL